MQCHDTRENLSAYIDGMLDQQVASLVEQHLQSCPGCRMEYEDLLAAVELVRELPVVEPPPGFRDELRERLLAGIAAGDAPGTPKPAACGLFGKRRLSLVAAAAVIFLAVGVTALWYGDRGLLFSPGYKGKVAGESHAVARNEPDNLTGVTEPAGNIMALKQPGDVDGELRSNPVPAPGDAPRAVIEKSNEASSGMEYQSPTGSAGDGTEEPGDTGSSRQSGVKEEAGFSIMAAPGTENGEWPQFNPAVTEEEKTARAAAPHGVGAGPGPAVEYSVTLQVYDRREAILQVSELVENYGGFIEPQEGRADNYMLLTVPFYNARTLIDEIGQLGTITDQRSKPRDLTTEIEQIEKNILELEARERVLAEQLAAGNNAETTVKELTEVRERIAGRRAELALLNKGIMMSKVELVLNEP